jgi:C-terminal peptidase prc
MRLWSLPDPHLALRLGFAMVVPVLILAWSLVTVLGSEGTRELSGAAYAPGVPASARSGHVLSQAGQDAATPTIEVYDPNKAQPSTPTAIPQEERTALFDDVWSTVEQGYIDPEFNGVDWEGLREDYRRRVLDAPTAQDYYGAIVEMVGLLNDGRSSFTPPSKVPMPATGKEEAGFANIGVTRIFDDNSLLVLYVYPNGPADKLGIERRDRITAINGRPVTSAKDDLALSGIVGSRVTLTVVSPGGQPRDMELKREIAVGPAPIFARQLSEDPTLVYLAMPTLSVANVDQISLYLLNKMQRQFLMQDVPLKGLVVDLRQTTGSSQQTLSFVLGEVTTGNLGNFESRDVYNNFDLDVPEGPLYKKYGGLPLVLLVDEGTRGDAEIMAAALQAEGRAMVLGKRTAGNTVSNETYPYPDGSVLSIAQWRFFLPDGTNIDGRGVTPDVEVGEDWTRYAEDNDPYIPAAVSLLHSLSNP